MRIISNQSNAPAFAATKMGKRDLIIGQTIIINIVIVLLLFVSYFSVPTAYAGGLLLLVIDYGIAVDVDAKLAGVHRADVLKQHGAHLRIARRACILRMLVANKIERHVFLLDHYKDYLDILTGERLSIS